MNRKKNAMSWCISRRQFLKQATLAGSSLLILKPNSLKAGQSPNAKLAIAVIGCASRGAANLEGVKGERIVALCDVNEGHLKKAALRFPEAKTYTDWRKCVEQKDVDAVVCSTTDHTHAFVNVWAMNRGKHVYSEKPLANSVHEARVVRETYLKNKGKLATQMGTQIHVTDNFRRVVEMVRGGAIGKPQEAHVWCMREGLGTDRPAGDFPVPADLNWDLWLGPAPSRPYNPAYLPGCAKWNKYWDFGCGVLGDMGSHLIDFPFAALDLRLPAIIEAEGPAPHSETYPKWMKVRWDHPAAGNRPAVKVFWYDGKVHRPNVPKEVNTDDWHGVLYVGDKAMMWVNYGGYAMLPVDDVANFKPPKPNVPGGTSVQGHYDEWIRACKTGSPTACNFDYAGTLIEHNMLGIVSYRTGRRIQWDAQKMQAIDCPEADAVIHKKYREGWTLND